MRLEDQGASTLLRYSGEAQVGGRIASVGQRLLDSSAKVLTRQSLDGLHEQVKARLQDSATHHAEEALIGDLSPVSPAAASGSPVAAPSQTEFALGVAKHLVDDLVPSPQRPKLIAGGVIFLASLVVLNWWMNAIAQKVAKEVWKRRI